MFFNLMNWLFAQEEGQDLAEYGLVLALIAIVTILALTALGTGLSDILQSVADAL